jgi:hypothetical protein
MVDYVDRRGAPAQRVFIWMEQGMLQLAGHGVLRQIPIHHVNWPSHAASGPRTARLADGGLLHTHDGAAWDAWVSRQGMGLPSAIKSPPSRRWSLIATLLLLAVCATSYWWGLPIRRQALTSPPPHFERPTDRSTLW